MSSKSNYTDLKMSLKEKKLKEYRNRVNSLSNSPRKPTDLKIVEKRRCVSESNASMNGIASLGTSNTSNSSSPIPTNPQSPSWDLAKLAHDSESLAQSVAKELQKAESLKNGGLVAWIRKWSRKKQIGKVIAMFEDLLPKLQNTEEEVKLWLTALAEKKEATLVESATMLKDMETSIGVYESYVDFYDELINDCLKISLDVSRELSDLRIAGSLNEVYTSHMLAYGYDKHPLEVLSTQNRALYLVVLIALDSFTLLHSTIHCVHLVIHSSIFSFDFTLLTHIHYVT